MIISSMISRVELEGTNSSLVSIAPTGSTFMLMIMRMEYHANSKIHTDCGSWGTVGTLSPLPEGELDVVGEGVWEVPGNKALYMSFLRGLPLLMRSPPEEVSDGFLGNGRAGGGMLLGEGTLIVFAGPPLETVGDEFAAVGRETAAAGLVRGGLFGTEERPWDRIGCCALCSRSSRLIPGSLLTAVARGRGASTGFDTSSSGSGGTGLCVGCLDGAGGLGGTGGLGGATFGRFSRMRELSCVCNFPRGLDGSRSEGAAELKSGNVSGVLSGCAGGAGVVLLFEGLVGTG